MRWLLTLIKSKSNANQSLKPSDQPRAKLLVVVNAGYLAMTIGAVLSYSNRKQDQLFFQVIRTQPHLLSQHREPVIRAAARMLEWYENGDNLPDRISQYETGEQIARAMRIVYSNHKDQLFSDKRLNEEHVKRDSQDIWYVYRDILAAATQNKLLLVEAYDVERFKDGVVLIEERIEERSDISRIRHQAKKSFEARQFSKSAVMNFLLVLSEAMTNVYKHASHGKVMIVEKDGALHLIVEDSGTGIPLDQLPKATLFSGYSSMDSMGQGFTIMLKIASCVHLHTSEEGSKLVISFDQPEKAKIENLLVQNCI